MAACAKNRCGNCGAELRARHLGMTRIGDSDIRDGFDYREGSWRSTALVALLGRFGVHHLACADGRLVYFHGIGRFGRRLVLSLASIEECAVMFRVACFSTDAQVPHAIGLVVKGERKSRRIFRDCRPRFYHWAEGWLEAARQNCRTDTTKGA